MPRWLILVHRIPPKPLYLRAKIRQRLAQVGAVAVKNAVYLLPHGAEALEDMQWISQEIEAGGGEAHLFEGDFVNGVAAEEAIAQFREARDADYRAIAAEAKPAADLARLSRRLEEVRRIDFFDAPARAQAEKALAAMEKKNRKEETRVLKANPELRGKTWVTRPGVKVDRMASAWFIRRFIDPKARFRFADEKTPKRDGELRFDMVGGEFTHEDDRCTFETLVRRIGLPDRGVRAIAEIVHDLDLKDAKFDCPEAAGVRMMLEGLLARTVGDDERIERALPIFDDLHEALGKKRGRK